MVDEILRTAASSTKLRPVLARALETLRSNPDKALTSCSRLQQLSEEVASCRSGMRPHEVQPAEDLCAEMLRAKAEQFINLSGEQVLDFGVTSDDLECLLQGLQHFKDKPGIFDLITEVRNWLAEHQKSMTLADLADIARKSAAFGVVGDMNQLQQLMTRCVKVKVDEKTVPTVTSLLSSAVRAFLTEAGQNKSITLSAR